VGAALGYLAGGNWDRCGLAHAVLSLRHPGLVLAALYGWIGREPVRGSSDHILPQSNATHTGALSQSAFLSATFGLATLTFVMGGISAWVPTFLHRTAGFRGKASMWSVHYGHRRHCRNPNRRLDCATLAAHQPPRALPALILERRAHLAIRAIVFFGRTHVHPALFAAEFFLFLNTGR